MLNVIREGRAWAVHIARVLREFVRDVGEALFGRDIEATHTRVKNEIAELEARREDQRLAKREAQVQRRLRSAQRLHNQVEEAREHAKHAEQARAELKRQEAAKRRR